MHVKNNLGCDENVGMADGRSDKQQLGIEPERKCLSERQSRQGMRAAALLLATTLVLKEQRTGAMGLQLSTFMAQGVQHGVCCD